MEIINFTQKSETATTDQQWVEFFREVQRLAALSRARRAAREQAYDEGADL